MTSTTARSFATAVDAAALRRLRVEAPDGFVDSVLDTLGLHAADQFVTVQSPAGDLFVAFNDDGISAVMPAALFDDDPATVRRASPRRDRAPARRRRRARPPAWSQRCAAAGPRACATTCRA